MSRFCASPSACLVKTLSTPYAPVAPAAKRKTLAIDGFPWAPVTVAPVDHTVIA